MTPTSIALTAVLFLGAVSSPAAVLAASHMKSDPEASGEGAEMTIPEDLFEATWEWIWFGSGAEKFDVETPEQYTIQFFPDGTAAIRADCNRGRANYEFKPDGEVELSTIAVTMMLCEEPSLGDRFIQTLDLVRLHFQMEGDFFMEAPLDSGTLRFRRAAAD